MMRSCARSISVGVVMPQTTAAPNRKSAEKGAAGVSGNVIPFPCARRPIPEVDMVAETARVIRAAFPAPSQHQCCLRAARALGTSPDTIDRILSGSTSRIDGRLMFAALAWWSMNTGNAWDIGKGWSVRIAIGGGQ